jgi:hypothetical protein
MPIPVPDKLTLVAFLVTLGLFALMLLIEGISNLFRH